ncbi:MULTISPECIES: acetylornithine deacetylase [Gammaproteobacteria]|uniref:acetylornithine deacetylase n=1 Tax=Gammaproteobacteria TaxID=1236 RepID=UPI000DD0B624|nr:MULTISPECIES: acetylornithine deacetylase [Gammaproteobacteria]RTE87498.1 acetylornithine deacetylase [Aliidiomarina sp. B3213]TCZ92717.1 acetylornithine deacetylase [Lysobacter sp. N42]
MAALPEFISMYKSLIALPSVSCLNPQWDMSNEKVIQQLGQWLEGLGFHVQIEPLSSQPNKFNLLAHIGPAHAQGGLLLSGHTDTVPWDEGRWTRDPFTLTEADGKLYGLGSADMKGFFVFVLEALKNIDLSKLTKPIYVLATADEETSMAGARELSKFPNLKPDYAIIGEPTSMTPVRMHKGHSTDCVRILGKSGHSSDPEAGVNAIDIMHEVLGELKVLKSHLKDNYHEPAFKVPYPTMNFGHIHGGDAANRICACCELHMDMRPLPGMSVDLLSELLHQQLSEIQKRFPNALVIEAMHEPIPGYQCAADSALVKMAERVSGQSSQPANYCTEAPFIDDLGCQTIVMGPGSINQAHQPDEFIRLDEIKPSLNMIERMIKEMCL